MSKKIGFIMKPGDNSYTFPDECVYCGNPRTTPLACNYKSTKLISQRVEPLVKYRTYSEYSVKLLIPYCQDHIRVSRLAKPVLIIATVVGFVLGAVALFGLLSFLPSNLSSSTSGGVGKDIPEPILVVLVLTFCIGGSILAQWLAKILAARFLYSSFKDVPILAWLVDNDLARPHALGMVVKINEGHITFSFINRQIGDDFEKLNRKFLSVA
jgi:hypothetical protein